MDNLTLKLTVSFNCKDANVIKALEHFTTTYKEVLQNIWVTGDLRNGNGHALPAPPAGTQLQRLSELLNVTAIDVQLNSDKIIVSYAVTEKPKDAKAAFDAALRKWPTVLI